MTETQPSWYDELKLRRVAYADNYYGWVIDCGDGTCRYVNEPLLGADFGQTRTEDNSRLMTEAECEEANRNRPHWGDRVRWACGRPDPKQIVERYHV